MPTLAYDLEMFPNLFTAAFKDVETGERTYFVIYDGWAKEHNAQKWEELQKFVSQPDLTLVGFNSYRFDNVFLARLLDKAFKRPLTCEGMYNLAQALINRDDLSDKMWRTIKRWSKWKHKFQSIDLMEIIAVNLNRPSLKGCAIHLKHHKLQDLPLPYNLPVQEEDIPVLVKYNFNDVEITEKLYFALQDEIEMRRELGVEYRVDLLSAGDSAITNIIFEKEYGKPDVEGTERARVYGHQLLPRHYEFKTPEMQSLVSLFYNHELIRGESPFTDYIARQMVKDNSLEGIVTERMRSKKGKTYKFQLEESSLELKLPPSGRFAWSNSLDNHPFLVAKLLVEAAELKVVTFKNGNKLTWGPEKFAYEFEFDGSWYTFGVGGMHSKDTGGVFRQQEGVKILDADVSSYYPRLRQNENFYPAHLDLERIREVDIKLTNRRLEAKAKGQKAKAEGLKISVNGAFGKMKYSGFWLYDPLCFFQTTIGGQIYLLDLIEKLALVGIKCVSANTDGVLCLVPDEKEQTYHRLCQEWQEKTSLELEFTEYDLYVRRDVNAYIARSTDGKVKTKNVFLYNDKLTVWSFRKGFSSPIVSIALQEYFLNGTPVESTIRKHDDIHDFMITQRSNRTFTQIFETLEGKTELQKTNRFIATTKGGIIYKQAGKKRTSLLKGRTVMVLNDVESTNPQNYPLDYAYYIAQAYKIVDKIEPQQMNLFAQLDSLSAVS